MPDEDEAVDQTVFPSLHFSFKWSTILLYIAFLVFCNVVIPVLLFYLLQEVTGITTKTLIGVSSAALGLSSCFDAPFRLYRLARFRRSYGPLGTDIWWHLDFVMWTYTFALLVFAIPLAVAPAVPLYHFFLMSTVMLVGPIGIVLLYSLPAFKLPCRCSSDPKGTPMKPAVYYIIEDVAAVDFRNGREFRVALGRRYTASMPFRRLMYHLTAYWSVQCAIYIGITAAVTWNAPLNFAFGWVLGQLFLWMGAAVGACVWLVMIEKRREKFWWNAQEAEWNVKRPGTREVGRENREGWEKV